jgi:hypothetical protein
VLDEKSISSPYSGTLSLKSFGIEFLSFLKEMGHSRLPSLKHFKPLDKLLCRAKAGPNGASVATSHIDAEFYSQNPELHLLLNEFNQLLGQT